MGPQKDDLKPEKDDLKPEKDDLKQEKSNLKQEMLNEKKVEKFEASSVINSSELRESDFLKKEVMVSNSEIMVTETENFKELTKVEETTTFKEEQDSKVSITNFEKTEIDFNESKAKVESYNNANIEDEVLLYDSTLAFDSLTH